MSMPITQLPPVLMFPCMQRPPSSGGLLRSHRRAPSNDASAAFIRDISELEIRPSRHTRVRPLVALS